MQHWLARGAVALLLFVAACINQNDNKGNEQSRKQRMLTATGPGVKTALPPKAPPQKALKLVGGEMILPAYKTKWERDLERRTKGAQPINNPYIDQYDDYRNNHFDRYFITKPPTSTAWRAPAEHEPSQAYVLHWAQYSQTAWNTMFGEIVKGAWGKVPVLMVYEHAQHKAWLESQLQGLGFSAAEIQDPKNIIWWQHDTDAIWARDYGPISLVSTPGSGQGDLSFVDFRYYHTRVYDDVIPTDLAKDWGINVFRPDLDMEPGNFMNTEDGLCAMTKGTLTSNPQFAQSAIEDLFKNYVGCKGFLWPEPMAGGVIQHIDMFSKFGPNYAAMVAEYTQTQDATNKAILDANAQLFAQTTTPSGKSLTVTRIPMPDQGGSSSNPIWRTYTNSLALSNGTDKVVLVPVYAQETSKESQAMAAYSTVFPGWTQVKITSDVIIPGQGATHCITMQIPLGTKAKMEADPADLCGPSKIACVIATCGNITSEGCCDGQTLRYCDGGKIAIQDCTNNPSCGWDSSNAWYDCGTAGSADPSGTNVKNCGVLTDAPLPDMGPDTMPTGCGNITYEGCCDGETVWYCDNGQLTSVVCTQNAQQNKCSWDSTNSYYDCGTSGSADPSGTNPQPCGTLLGDGGSLPPTDGMPTPDQGVGCGNVTYEGCCDGSTLKFCQSGQLQSIDCSSNPSCGWNSQGGFYDCGTGGTADPSGTYPLACGGASVDASTSDVFTPDTMPFTPDQSVATFDQGTTTSDLGTSSSDHGAAVDSGGSDGDGDGDGCSCRVAQTPSRKGGPSGTLLLGFLAGLWLVRRRRS